MSDFRKRRQRRQSKQFLAHGKKAKASHKLKAGRTGGKFSHNLKGLKP